MYAQVAGGLLLGYAYLLWWAPGTAAERPVAGATAVVNTLGVVVVGTWLLAGELETGALGDVMLWTAVAALAVFAVAETRIATRR